MNADNARMDVKSPLGGGKHRRIDQGRHECRRHDLVGTRHIACTDEPADQADDADMQPDHGYEGENIPVEHDGSSGAFRDTVGLEHE